jgi:serine/threonine-protein kinase RsbW
MPEQRVSLTIEGRLDAVPLLGRLVNALGAVAKLSSAERSQVEVCVLEAVNNCIKHAYRQAPGKTVEVEASVLSDRLVFDIFDSGKSADPVWMHADHSAALELSPDPNQLPESGRGLAIMQEYMDGVEYTPGGTRNRLRLTKNLKNQQA